MESILSFPLYLTNRLFHSVHGTYVNGVLHFIVRRDYRFGTFGLAATE